jgi:FkbM family methyltransferase
MSVSKLLNRFRESYYGSLLLASVAKPVHDVCKRVSRTLERKVRKNGAAIRLANGRTMLIGRDCGVWLGTALFWHGLDGHERETSQVLQFFFARSATLIDVGANYGFYSILGALWNPNLQVVAFEPVPAIFASLKKNIALNHLEGRVICENLALAGQSGEADLYLPDKEGMDYEATATLAPDSWQVRRGSPHLRVTTVSFDDYEASHPMKIDLIKIDVEDFEATVLAGMQGIIRRDRPFIVCEILPRNREHKNEQTRQIVESLGYTPYWITPVGCVRVSRFDFERPHHTDFLLSPVSVPDEIVTNLDVLWSLREAHLEV